MFDRFYQVAFVALGLLFLFAGCWTFHSFPNMGPEGFLVVVVMIIGIALTNYGFNRRRS